MMGLEIGILRDELALMIDECTVKKKKTLLTWHEKQIEKWVYEKMTKERQNLNEKIKLLYTILSSFSRHVDQEKMEFQGKPLNINRKIQKNFLNRGLKVLARTSVFNS